jgi:hypothetical protein
MSLSESLNFMLYYLFIVRFRSEVKFVTLKPGQRVTPLETVEDARERRSDCARGVDHRAVQRNGRGHQVSAHDFRNEGRPRRDLIPDEQAGLAGEESAAREPVPCPVGYG